MIKKMTSGLRVLGFEIKGGRLALVCGLLMGLIVFVMSGCGAPIVQGEKDSKPVIRPEAQNKVVGSPVQKSPEPSRNPGEVRKGADDQERIGKELELAVRELKENVVTLKNKLDEEVAQNSSLFKKDPPEYKIRPGDVIEIIYHMLYEENPAQYLLEIQDSVKIEFFNQPELSRTVSLRSDGKITLPLVGDIHAAGLSTLQLENEVIKRYKKYLIDPIVTIYLERSNVKIDELKKAITTAPRGQSKISPVRPDGRTSFPFIGDIKVAGLTVEEVRKVINEKYRSFVRNLEITVVIERVVNPTIFVSGEVNGPGDLTITGPLYLSQVISRAKGLTPTADGKHVMVIRRFGVSKPVAFHVNLDAVLLKGDISKDILLTEDDMVYVPRASRHRFFICGEVNVPGVYPIFPEEPLTLSQAISMANGFRMTASLGSVMVLRRGEGQPPQAFRIDFKKVLSDGDISQDILIQKNDVIFLPKTFISKADDFIEQWLTRGIYSLFPANSTLDFIIDLDTVRNLDKRSYNY